MDRANEKGMPQFSENLRIARRRKRMSQPELAQAVGCSAQSISNYENGIKIPSVAIAAKIASVLAVSLDWLTEIDNLLLTKSVAYLNKGDFADALCKMEQDGAIALVQGSNDLIRITDKDLIQFWTARHVVGHLLGTETIDSDVAENLQTALIGRLREVEIVPELEVDKSE